MSETSALLYGDSPLACAWLAASLEKKLSKQQYLKTSILDSTKAIEQSSEFVDSEPKLVSDQGSDSQFQFLTQTQGTKNNEDKDEMENNVEPIKSIKKVKNLEPITLRISGQLLYGVVKIYSRKTRYLFEEISLALIQLKSAFSVSKSITLPIEKTVVSSLNNITLKDTVTEANVLYETDGFDINKVFGISNDNSSNRNTQFWAASNSVIGSNDDYAVGDISIGRNVTYQSEITGNVTTNDIDEDFSIPNFDNDNNDFENVGNDSIDALSRRAQVAADDLEGAEEFELPIDLNLKEGQTENMNDEERNNLGSGNVPGISDFHLSAIDNMDLEFTVDETHADNSKLIHENILANIESDDDEEMEKTAKKARKRTRKPIGRLSYKNTDVVRTQRKKLIVDSVYEISTEQLKKNQSEYSTSMKAKESGEVIKPDFVQNIIEDLNPLFLSDIGSSWKSIKRRKLLKHNTDNDVDEDSILPNIDNKENNNNIEVNDYDVLPEFEPIDSADIQLNTEDISRPERENTAEKEISALESNHENEDNQQSEQEESFRVDSVESGEIKKNQIEDEIDENFEDLHNKYKTTVEVARELRNVFDNEKQPVAVFDDIADSCKLSENKKNNVTRAFFELLVLGTANTVKLQQDRLFGDITIESKEGLFEKFL